MEGAERKVPDLTQPGLGPQDWDWWWGVWRDRIRCGTCEALMDLKSTCPVCATDHRNVGPTEFVLEEKTIAVPPAFAGALDWSPYVMLKLMHREWVLPPAEGEALSPTKGSGPSARVLVLLVFWTYFETLMDWFYERATADLPPSIAKDLLARYSSIGARLERLHRVLFGAVYGEDLARLGQAPVWLHLQDIQRQRNAFMHGNPESINDALVENTVMIMPDFQQAWIQSFNFRCAKRR
jgi:hypothetical protein